ncbi:hypothetical protein B0H16DRAFT_1805236 [Mycena metata]|uniref:Uncharacterized protein n=1 Tax=Mycena metata TaxID=1033252 RepID=A0AAD7H988_9AGAR|nr:hypothetical protein B0H16DRAFT_1805236 [Mycena metata]
MTQFTSMDLGIGMGIDTTDFGLFNPFQFTFEAPSPLPSSESESGGSTGSFSPPPSMRAASVDTRYSASTDDPAAELANRVRKNAGLVLAVQIGSEPQSHPPAFTAPPAPSYPPPNTTASAFTNTRCPDRTAHARHPSADHDAITAENIAHYHRAASPRQAVPALHVVDRAATIKAGEPYPGGDASDPKDHIDAHGFVDGVKIARKCSKANVLGSTSTCSSREKGLTRELEGLKTLLRGLVGGTELLGEWEREWVGMFGGEEHDEVGVEDGANANEDDAEDNEEGESDAEGGAGRKRKKAKVEPALKPTIHVTLSVRDVHVVSVGWRGIGGKGKEDPPPSRHRRAPLHGGCVCRMRALHAVLVPISLVFAFTLPPHAIPPVPRPRAQCHTAESSATRTR